MITLRDDHRAPFCEVSYLLLDSVGHTDRISSFFALTSVPFNNGLVATARVLHARQQQRSAVQGVQRGAQGAAQSGGGTATEEKLVDAAPVVQPADLPRDCVHARGLRVRPHIRLHQAL